MKIISLCAAAALFLLVACSPPPAWQPGDEPLAIHAEDGEAQWAASVACYRWAMTGLECRFVDRASDATVTWRIVAAATCNPGHHCTGATDYAYGLDGWSYETQQQRDGSDQMARIATHELGHLLGLWEHLDDPAALMQRAPSADGPTSLDLDALADAWGTAPWEDAQP